MSEKDAKRPPEAQDESLLLGKVPVLIPALPFHDCIVLDTTRFPSGLGKP